MRTAFQKMFWGYLLVLAAIRIAQIDILPDPAGYALIMAGIGGLMAEFPIGKRAYRCAAVLIVASIPSVFMPQISDQAAFQIANGWAVYTFVMNLLDLILVFYMFQLMMEIGKKYGDAGLRKQTAVMFRVYMTAALLCSFGLTFTMNMSGNVMAGLVIAATIALLGIQLAFLVLLHRFQKLERREPFSLESDVINEE